MASENDILNNIVTNKQNFASGDIEEDSQVELFMERVRIWNKISRVNINGEERAVIVPFSTLIETFDTEYDIDGTVDNPAEFDATNSRYILMADANANRKVLQSEVVSFRNNVSIDSVNISVEVEDSDGNDASDNIIIELYNGQDWVLIHNNGTLHFKDTQGQDLDADLDADLGERNNSWDYDYQIPKWDNKLKYRITRVGTGTYYVSKVIMDFATIKAIDAYPEYYRYLYNKRLMDISDNHATMYVKMHETEVLTSEDDFTKIRINSDETLWQPTDMIKYFVKTDSNAYEEVTSLDTDHTFATPGKVISLRVILIGNGASSTYVEKIRMIGTI